MAQRIPARRTLADQQAAGTRRPSMGARGVKEGDAPLLACSSERTVLPNRETSCSRPCDLRSSAVAWIERREALQTELQAEADDVGLPSADRTQ